MGNKPSAPTELNMEVDNRPDILNENFRDEYGAIINLKTVNKLITQKFSFRTPSSSSEQISKWILQVYNKDELLNTIELDKNFKNTDDISIGGTNINDFFSNNKFVSFSLNFGWYENIVNPEDIKIFIYIEIPGRDPINIRLAAGKTEPYYSISARFNLTKIILQL